VEEDEGTIRAHVGRNPRYRKQFEAFPDGEHGKEAITHYKVLERFHYVTLVECVLETGRTHQIRVHMKYLGHPLFNDDTYGGDKILKGTVFSKYRQFVENCFAIMPRHALHARSLGFIHPSTKKEMNFDSEVADDMKAVVEKWRSYSSNVIKAGLEEREERE
jgi:23S rRNA pseudouridine1911/1915/1917 synthase